MNKNTIITLVIGVVIGVTCTVGIPALVNNDEAPLPASTDHSTMSMAEMNKQLEGLSDDDYDKAFIEMMIAHHQGAIDMAELSSARAKHSEIKQLSKDIITAQEKEIGEMYQWQAAWGYAPDESMQNMHGSH